MAKNLRAGLRQSIKASRKAGVTGAGIFSLAPLDLRFALQKTLDPRITFTRASTGTYVGSDGLIKSATTNEARFDHNPTTGESLGLLVEEARTNLSLYSEDFSNVYWVKTSCTITSNESTAPDGTLTADLWTNTASPGTIENSITKDLTVRTYTASLWVKGTLTQLTLSLDDGTTGNRGRVQFNLSTNTVGSIFNEGSFSGTSGTLTRFLNGWVRVTVTTTTSTGATLRLRPFFSGVGSILRIWGAQVEEGAFATSCIPTTTATATRAADVANITGTNFSSWYSQTEGTVFAEYSRLVNASGRIFTFNDTTANEQIRITASLSTNIRPDWQVIDGGAVQANVLGTAEVAVGATGKTAGAYKLNDFQQATNSTLGTADTTGTLPTLTVLNIGANETGSGSMINGTIKRLTYWPVRLANPTLQSITTP
jgi:hypothetical protein